MSFVQQFFRLRVCIQISIIFSFIWSCIAILYFIELRHSKIKNTTKIVPQAMPYFEQIKLIQAELETLIDEYLSNSPSHSEDRKRLLEELEILNSKAIDEPTLEYQKLLRRIRTNTDELWNLVKSKIYNVQNKLPANTDTDIITHRVNNFLELGFQNKFALIKDLENLQKYDNYDNWRFQEAKKLSNLVQTRLFFLQNPKDCNTARKIICQLNEGCGYGCLLHHLVYCFIMAYSTERTLIFKSIGWKYHKAGWEGVFKPLSHTCTDSNGASHSKWPGSPNTQVIVLDRVSELKPQPPFSLRSIPADLAPRLIKLHGHPIVWWVGQFLKYMLKPQPQMQALLDASTKRLGFKTPIVGIHVRRTDKIEEEASFHNLEEYMVVVEEYYKQQEIFGAIIKRRVFIATDDHTVIEEAYNKYPGYEIISDYINAFIADVSTRYTNLSLNSIILDIHLLSMCDFLVCTFSSHVCRVAYEIMQTNYPDATSRFRSLDDFYYYSKNQSHRRLVVVPHIGKHHGELELKVGDLIELAGNYGNGYSKGRNVRTQQVGIFPSFKINDKVEVADFPTYPNVKEFNFF